MERQNDIYFLKLSEEQTDLITVVNCEAGKRYSKLNTAHCVKTCISCIAMLLLSFCARAQQSSPFISGFEKTMPSIILGSQRTIWIHVPGSNGKNEHYPVIYLLDGDANFNSVVSITEFMSNAGLCPPMIVVGILHPDRMTDLTFGTDKETPGIVGTGEKFMRYVEKELMPYIESNYPTASYKIFIGHSVGGLTVVNTLIHHPNLFNAYVSLDGALWWNDQQIVKDAKMNLASKNYEGKTLYMALANRMEKGMDTVTVQQDTTEGTELIRSNLEFIRDISKNKTNQLRFQYAFYVNDDHSSVRLIGEYDALRFIFDYYKLKIYNSELEDPYFKLDSLLVTHYNNVSAQIGYLIKPGESQVNNLAYHMLNQKQFIKAEALFKLNITNYPETANCYDGLGDLYLAKGDKLKAIESFKKTLTLKQIPETKEKLEKLLREKK